MTSPQPWTWDVNRNSYFRWSAEENCYIYQDGSKVQPLTTQTRQAPAAAQSTAQDPRYVPPTINRRTSASSGRSGGYSYGPDVEEAMSNLTINQDAQPEITSTHGPYPAGQQSYFQQQHPRQPAPQQPTSAQQSYAAQQQYLIQQQYQQQQHQTPSPYNSNTYTPAVPQTPQATSGHHISRQTQQLPAAYEESVPEDAVYEQYPDPTDNTDPTLLRQGAKSYRRLRGLQSSDSTLNTDFRIQRSGKEFFRLGKVFKVYWPEPISQTLTGKTSVTAGGMRTNNLNREIFAKIRWFVVVKPGEGRYCSCLPIQTYGNQGVAKKDVVKWSHAIIYTGKEPPPPNDNELPGVNERPMLQPIRVVSNKRTDIMDRMSRVDFNKIYTVEHNVKVYDFGRVHEDERDFFRHQFNYVWGISQDMDEESEDEADQPDKKKKRERHPKAKKSTKGEKSTKTERSSRAHRPTKEESLATQDTPAQIQGRRYVRVIQAYSSPTTGHLDIEIDDMILLTGAVDENWWMGRNERTLEMGMFPSTYVKEEA